MRGTNYIPYRTIPPLAYDIPGVRVSRNGAVLVPWTAKPLIEEMGYSGGFKTLTNKIQLQADLAFVDGDVFDHHPFISDETRRRATPAQREDLKKMLRTSGGILDWPTGSGKTLIGLTFATSFGLAEHGTRALVIAPSTTTEQWRLQAARWLDPKVRVGIITSGQPAVRLRETVTWRIDEETRVRLRRSGGVETLLFRDEWPNELVTDEERAILRRAKAERISHQEWIHLDDLGAVVGGPFPDKASAVGALGTWTPGDYDVLVVGWGLLAQDVVADAFLSWAPTVLVVDEAHRSGKGGSMWRHIKAKPKEEDKASEDNEEAPGEFVKKKTAASHLHSISTASAGAVLLMTATPQGDVPRNWHALCDIYDPYSFGSYHKFCMRYADGHKGEYGMVYDGLSNADELRARLRRFWVVRSKAETHKGLPPVRREFVELDLRDVGRGTVDLAGLRGELRDAEMGGSPVAIQLAVATEQKIPWARDRIIEDVRSGLKVFVWVALRANGRTLHRSLVEALPDTPIFRGDGEMSSAERVSMVERFITGESGGKAAADLRSDEKPAVMIGTLGAFGEAIDGLQHIDVAYVLTLPWTPQQLIQGPEGRHSRVGGTRSVLLKYVRLIGTVDDVVWSRLGEKLGMVADVREDDDAKMLGAEIRGDSPEAVERSLGALAEMLVDWEKAPGAWRENASLENYYEDD